MTLHISEADVRAVFTMPLAIEAVENISRKQANGEVVVQPRRRFELPDGGFFHYMAAVDLASGFVAMKQYTYVKGKLKFLVPLYATATGDLLALIEADYMGQLRTGAASGVATRFLAREDAHTAAIIGTGDQAKTQLEAVANVRKLDFVRVYGRDPQRRAAFAEEMSKRIGVNVEPAESSAAAARGADIICTATTSAKPVLFGADVSPGTHINAIGANHKHKHELDVDLVAKAGFIAVDSIEQSREEAGDLVLGFQGDEARWNTVAELDDVVARKLVTRANAQQITLFKSNGIASWDLAAAEKVYALAKEKSLGRELPLWKS